MTLKWRAKGSRIGTLTRAFTSGDAEEAAFAARSVADLRTERRRPSARLTTRKDGPRADRSDTTGSRWPASAWWGSTMVTSGTIPSKTGVSRSVRGPRHDAGRGRPPRPPRHHLRDERRKLPTASRSGEKARPRTPPVARNTKDNRLIDAPRQSTSKIRLAPSNPDVNHQPAATPNHHPDCRRHLIQIVAPYARRFRGTFPHL
jgi:hypothetical protein